MHLLISTALVVLLAAGAPAGSQNQAEARDALDGLDPVLLVAGKEVPGKSAFSVTRGEFIYLFSTADTKATFEHEPARYEIQLGGLCAKMGKTAGGNPSDFVVHEGKIYIFGSDDCHKKFQAAPAKYLTASPAPLPASSSAATRGRQLVERAVEAVGGAARLDALTSYVESFSQIQKRPQGEATITTRTMWSFPDRVRQERTMALQGKTMSSATILAPQGMWFLGGGGQAFPIRPASWPSLEQDFGRHPVALLRARRSPTFKAVALGTATVDGVGVENVRVVNGETDVTLAIEAKGRIQSATFRDRNADGEYGTFTVVYSDFRPVEGLQLAFNNRATFNGQPYPAQSVTIDTILLNTPLDLSLFGPKTPGDR
jgi:YHS domain-containing protein